MKKFSIVVLVLGLLISLNSTRLVQAEGDFEGNESQYIEMCKRTDLNRDEANTCSAFKKYMEGKNQQYDSLKADIEGAIQKSNDDLTYVVKEILRVEGEIAIKNQEIDALNVRIIEIQDRITAREIELKDRMYAWQPILNTDWYTEFIFSAKSFDVFLRSVETVEQITQYDKDLIRSYIADKEALDADKVTLDEAKVTLEELQAGLVGLKQEYEAKLQELAVQLNGVITASEELKNSISNINTEAYIPPNEGGGGGWESSGWLAPLPTAWISAGTWYYPGSSYVHNGMDFAAPVGTAVLAPANGYVVAVKDNCATYSYPGDPCRNVMTANYVIMVVQVNGNVYSLEMAHNRQGAGAESGWNGEIKYVTQGTKLSEVGSSGYSTGPHLHHMIINHGPSVSVGDVIDRIYSSGSYFFGLGTGYPQGSSCGVKGSFPCYERPEDIYGLYVGASY